MWLQALIAVASASDPLSGAPPAGAPHPQDVAVVVGNEDYAFLPDVPYALRDADLVYDALVHTRGIPPERVWDLRGANREQLLGAVDGAIATVGPGGTIWLYFAGHGAASPSTTAPLLVGDDAKRDPEVFESRSVSVPELQQRVGDRRLVLITDACFTGAGRDGEALVPGARFVVPAWTGAPAPNHLIVTAAAPDQVAGPYDAVDHGLFTFLFVGGLRGWADGATGEARDGRVTAVELEQWIGKALRALQVDDQRPVWSGAGDQLLAEAAGLESPPDLASLPRPGDRDEAPVAAPRPAALPWVPPYHHVGGSQWADTHDLPMPGAQVRMLASQDVDGLAAVRRMRTVPVTMGVAGAVGLEGLIVGLVMLPLSASPGWAETPEEVATWRGLGLGGLAVAGAVTGWEIALGQRLKHHRAEVAEAAARHAAD